MGLRLSDYRATPEGEALHWKYMEKVGGLGPREEVVDDLLVCLMWGASPSKAECRDYLELLPELERRGLVVKVDEDITFLLGSIGTEEIKRDLDVYRRLAEGGEVSDSEVDALYGKAKRFIRKAGPRESSRALRGVPKETWGVITGLVEDARSRSDKVIAIDTVMSLVHDTGGIEDMGLWKYDSLGDDSVRARRILTRLFEGEGEAGLGHRGLDF